MSSMRMLKCRVLKVMLVPTLQCLAKVLAAVRLRHRPRRRQSEVGEVEVLLGMHGEQTSKQSIMQQ